MNPREIAGIHHPIRQKILDNQQGLGYRFLTNSGKVFSLCVEGVSEKPFLELNNSNQLFATSGGGSLHVSDDFGETWSDLPKLKGINIRRFFSMSNGHYLVGGYDSKNNCVIQTIDENFEAVCTIRQGNALWNSNNSIDEMDGVIMYSEYQNFKAELPTNVSIYRTSDFGISWEEVFSHPHPGIRHWHTLKADPFRRGTWIATSGDTPEQSKWFITEDIGEEWEEITDMDYICENSPRRSKSAHRTTTFLVNEDSYIFATDDLMGSVPQFLSIRDGVRASSSKLFSASKTSPTRLMEIANLGIHIRSLIDVGPGFIAISEAQQVSFDSQIFFIPKETPIAPHLLFTLPASMPHGGTSAMSSHASNGLFFSYWKDGCFRDSRFQTLRWKFDFSDISPAPEFSENQIYDYVSLQSDLWRVNSNPSIIKKAVFSNGALQMSLQFNNSCNSIYLNLGNRNDTNSPVTSEIYSLSGKQRKTLRVEIEENQGVRASIFIQQFSSTEKIDSFSRELVKGANQIDFSTSSKCRQLGILLRLSNRGTISETSNISLCNLTLDDQTSNLKEAKV